MSLSDLSPHAFDRLAREYLKKNAISRRGVMVGAAAMAGAMSLGRPGFASEATSGGTLRVGRAEEPDTLDPHKTTLSVSSMTMDQIYEPLTRRDFDNNVVPGLAESWEFSNGNRTLTFRLKPGAMFQDGTPLDAEAVAWTVARHLDPATESTSLFFIGPLDHAEAIDPVTVAYHYTEPFVPVWVGLTLGYTAPISRAAVEERGDRFGREPVGGGPFRLVSWSPDRGMRLERFEEYTVNPQPHVDAIEFIHYPEDSTRLAALETGEINAVYFGASVPLDAVSRLRRNDELDLQERPAQMMRTLIFNQSMPPFDNLEVRQAFSHAIDQERLIAFALDGHAVPAHSPIASSIPGFDPATVDMGYGYDPERARELLARNGLAEDFECTLICNDTPVIRRSAEVVQAQLREVGVSVSIESLPIAQWSALSSQGGHHISLSTYTYPDADIVFPAIHTSGALNRMFVTYPELDEMIERQRVTADPDERQQILNSIQEFVLSGAHWKPLFEPLNFAVFANEVQNARLKSGGDVLLSELWIE